MSIEEKIEFVKSLKSGDYFYCSFIEDNMKFSYLSVFGGIEELNSVYKIEEFATTLYKSDIVADEEVGKLYYNTNCSLWKNDNTFGQINIFRKASVSEKRYFNKMLKKSYKELKEYNRLDEIPTQLIKTIVK